MNTKLFSHTKNDMKPSQQRALKIRREEGDFPSASGLAGRSATTYCIALTGVVPQQPRPNFS